MRLSALSAGIVAAVAGFGGSVAIVLAAAEALGATPAETVSWVTAISAGIAATTAILSLATRIPITTAWSTPGAAVLAAAAGLSMSAAVGAFLAVGSLIVLTAAIRPLGRLIERIPLAVASGMLAGVLLRFALAVFESAAARPILVLPLIAFFLLLRLWSPASATLAVLLAGVALTWALGLTPARLDFAVSSVTLIEPAFAWTTMVGVAVPLYIVTMASQNLAGAAVLRANGYTVPFNAALAVTGLASLAVAPFGGHTINLSAIAAAICTGPEAHPDPKRRWHAGISLAVTYAVIALFAGTLVAAFLALPAELLRTVAGLALTAPLVNALAAAVADPADRFAAILAFVVTASGVAFLGIGAAFWGLIAGLIAHTLEQAAARKA